MRWPSLCAAASALALFAPSCDDGYPIAARACDDFCRATERHGCSGQSPSECVRECKRTSAAERQECASQFRELISCLALAEDSEFVCEESVAEPASACRPLRRELAECLAPGGGACAEACWHAAEQCGFSSWRCELDCHALPAECGAESNAYYACAASAPVDCARVFGDEDPRPPGAIPCFGEALEFLACTAP
jgi:hypothetical protein